MEAAVTFVFQTQLAIDVSVQKECNRSLVTLSLVKEVRVLVESLIPNKLPHENRTKSWCRVTIEMPQSTPVVNLAVLSYCQQEACIPGIEVIRSIVLYLPFYLPL